MIIVDTGVFVALFNARDPYHISAKQVFNTDQTLITTYPVMTETCYMLASRVGHQAQINFLKSFCQNAFEIFPLQQHHLVRMIALMERYANLPIDMADASLVVLAESLGHGRILTIDFNDFYTYRWLDHNPFELLVTQHSKSA
jgi:uncharacterized protein